MKKMILALGVLVSLDAMAIVDGWYACKGTDRDGNKVALQFITAIKEGQSCGGGGFGEPSSCDDYLFLDGLAKIVLVDESLELRGIDFKGNARNPSYLEYGNDRVLARRRTELKLFDSATGAASILFSLKRPYKPFVEGVVVCERI